MGRRNWKDHPELVRLRENVLKRKVSAEEIEEVKAFIENQRKVKPVVRVVEGKPFSMSFRVRRNVVPVLSKTR